VAASRVSDEQLRAWMAEGKGARSIARLTGLSVGTIKERVARIRGRDANPADPDDVPQSVIRPAVQRPRISHVIELGPAPFAVPILRAARSNHGQSAKCWTALVLTDTHVPFQDEAALQVVYGPPGPSSTSGICSTASRSASTPRTGTTSSTRRTRSTGRGPSCIT
jgi:hypothetical protein